MEFLMEDFENFVPIRIIRYFDILIFTVEVVKDEYLWKFCENFMDNGFLIF